MEENKSKTYEEKRNIANERYENTINFLKNLIKKK